ncbi:MAG: CBS domain-containing protein [Pyrobaculum sp.]
MTIDTDAHVAEALLLMREANVRRLVVTKGGELYGVIALKDIVYNIPLLKIIADYFTKEKI